MSLYDLPLDEMYRVLCERDNHTYTTRIGTNEDIPLMTYFAKKYDCVELMEDIRDENDVVKILLLYNSVIIGFLTIDNIRIMTDDKILNCVYLDNLLIHPKYRKTGAFDVLRKGVVEYVMEHEPDITIWQTRNELRKKPMFVKKMYNIPLRESRFCKLPPIDFTKYKLNDNNIVVPTLDDMKQLNEKRYSFQIVYSDEELERLSDCKVCRMDKYGNMYVFCKLNNISQYSDAKSAVLLNYYIKDRGTFKESFIEIIRSDDFSDCSVVSILNDDVKNIISSSPYRRRCAPAPTIWS